MKGNSHRIPPPDKEAQAINRCRKKEKLAFPRAKSPNWLSNVKGSALKSYTQATKLDLAGCIFTFMHTSM